MALSDYFRMQQLYGGGNAVNANGGDNSGVVMSGMSPFNRANIMDSDMNGGISGNMPPPTGNVSDEPAPGEPPASIAAPPEDLGPQGEMDTTPVVTDTSRQTRDTDALRQIAGQYPNREQYKPSMLRRIGSIAVGIANGPAEQQKFKDTPYDEAVSDWKNKLAPAENLANLERYGNTSAQQGVWQQGRLGIMQGQLERQTTQGNERIKIAQQVANTKEEAVIMAQHKLDYLKDRHDISDSEKEALGQRYKLELENAKADHAKALQGVKDAAAMSRVNANGKINEDIQRLRTQGGIQIQEKRNEGQQANIRARTAIGSKTGALSTQQKVATQNLYGKALREHPEWANYINLDTNTGQVMIDTSGWFGGQHEDTRNAILKYFGETPGGSGLGGGVPTPQSGSTPNQPTATPNTPAPSPTEPNKTPANNPTVAPSAAKPKAKMLAPPADNRTPEPGYVKIASVATGKVIGQIPEEQASQVDTSLYKVVK